ncbi:MAG: DALR domain-containing protein, partial [Bacteroidales bacterium]
DLAEKCHAAMQDDFNSPVAIAHLFDAVRIINAVRDNKEHLSGKDLQAFRNIFRLFLVDIFGLTNEENDQGPQGELVEGLMEVILDLRKKARENRDWKTADQLREALKRINITIKDNKEGSTWEINR